jgi:cellulose synthase/poly-beta-1,6-N-acetylglucosamine synthase-like glycosyltransferase
METTACPSPFLHDTRSLFLSEADVINREFHFPDFKKEEEILCCITLYNEHSYDLFISLKALTKAIAFHYKTTRIINNIAVCIIADGAKHIPTSTLVLLKDLGFNIDMGLDWEFDMQIIVNNISISQIDSYYPSYGAGQGNTLNTTLQRSATDKKNCKINSIRFNNNPEIRFFLCVKSKNKGKLNSHWWFFTFFCREIQPKYCIQLDAGTAPCEESVYKLWKYMEDHKNTGALASRVETAIPSSPFNILLSWQFGDFLYQKILDWPAELLAGYLTVIPGQYSMFRWDALQDNPTGKEQCESSSPLENYFRGLKKLGPFESNMFLAEDRILGFEILSKPSRSWNLCYVPGACSITDACYSYPELFKQRRRWINSSFACNLWLMIKVKDYLKKAELVFKKKLQILLSILWLSINCLFQWFTPSLLIILMSSLTTYGSGQEAGGLMTIFSSYALHTFICLILLQFLAFFFEKYFKGAIKLALFSAVIQLLILLGGIYCFYSTHSNGFFNMNLAAVLFF